MNTKKILGVVAVLALVAVAMVGAGAADTTTREVSTLTELNSILASAADGDTVKLTADIDFTSLTDQVKIDKDMSSFTTGITLDLNGHYIRSLASTDSQAAAHTIYNNGGKVIITDNSGTGLGAILRQDTDDTKSNYAINNASGTMTINYATVKNGGNKASLVRNNGTMTINNLYFEQQCFIAIKNEDGATMTINGGTFKTGGSTAVVGKVYCALQNWGTATINGGTFTGAIGVGKWQYGTSSPENSKLTIKGGTFNLDAIWVMGVKKQDSGQEITYVTDVNANILEIQGVNVTADTILNYEKSTTVANADKVIALTSVTGNSGTTYGSLTINGNTWDNTKGSIYSAVENAEIKTTDVDKKILTGGFDSTSQTIDNCVEDVSSTGGNTVVNADVTMKYYVYIPSGVTLTTAAVDAEYTVTIKNPVTGADPREVSIKLNTTGYDSVNTKKVTLVGGTDTMSYTVAKGTEFSDIKNGDVIVSVPVKGYVEDSTTKYTKTQKLTYSKVDMTGKKAGTYTDTLTFAVTVA